MLRDWGFLVVKGPQHITHLTKDRGMPSPLGGKDQAPSQTSCEHANDSAFAVRLLALGLTMLLKAISVSLCFLCVGCVAVLPLRCTEPPLGIEYEIK